MVLVISTIWCFIWTAATIMYIREERVKEIGLTDYSYLFALLTTLMCVINLLMIMYKIY